MFRIPLEAIRDNPYQTRTQYDHIEELAESIYNMRMARPETSGLVQVPPARLWDLDAAQPLDPVKVDDDELIPLLNGGLVVVQLAAGHRRFRAFQHLVAHLDDQGYEYQTFPAELGLYTDDQMADLVWTENHDRADLSAIEEAEALQRDMQAFGWSQSEIGFRRGLSRPAVANKLRLLNLPDEAQAAIRAGQLTERHGRVLLRAQSLTPTIYKQLADELIPIPVPDEIAEQARALNQPGTLTFQVYKSEASCALCGTLTNSYLRQADRTEIFLCKACMRLATGWEPLNVASTEKRLENLIDHHSKRIDFFPVDVEIGKAISGPPCVRQPVCKQDGANCPMLAQQRHGWSCIDGECFKFKTESWESYLIGTLKSNLARRWPVDYASLKVDFDGYSGHQMDERDDVDRYLAEHVCSPACPHFSMRHYSHDYCHYVKLTGMPFIAICGSTSGYKACVRKLGKDEQAQAQLVEHNAALAEQQRLKQQIGEIHRRSLAALAQGIEQNSVAMLAILAKAIDSDAKNPYLVLAKWLASRHYVTFNPDQFVSELNPEKVAKYKRRLTKQLGDWGIKLTPTADELIARMDKIEEFIQINADQLTEAQVRGNIDNLEHLMQDLTQANVDHTLSETDYNRLYQRALHFHGWLIERDVTRETRDDDPAFRDEFYNSAEFYEVEVPA